MLLWSLSRDGLFIYFSMHDEQFKKKKSKKKNLQIGLLFIIIILQMVYRWFIYLFSCFVPFGMASGVGLYIVLARQVVGLFIHIVYYVIKLEY